MPISIRGPAAEVHLCLLARQHFQPAKRQWPALIQTPEEPANAGVAGGKAMPLDQVLIDPLARQALLELLFNDRPKRLTAALGTGASSRTR